METRPKAVATEIIDWGETIVLLIDHGMKCLLNIYNYTNRIQLFFTFVGEACYCRW